MSWRLEKTCLYRFKLKFSVVILLAFVLLIPNTKIFFHNYIREYRSQSAKPSIAHNITAHHHTNVIRIFLRSRKNHHKHAILFWETQLEIIFCKDSDRLPMKVCINLFYCSYSNWCLNIYDLYSWGASKWILMHENADSQTVSQLTLLPLMGSTHTVYNFCYWRAAQELK